MYKTNSKISSMGELIAVAEIKDMLARLETKVDLLLISSEKFGSDDDAVSDQDDDDEEWREGLDGITRYCVEQGLLTTEEVKKALREG